MKKTSCTIWTMVAVILAVVGGSARAVDPNTHIWIDQETGINHPDTPGTPNEPFKSITYALARAEYLSWPEPWHIHIGPGVYDADPLKPGSEREIFPIELRQNMIFEGGDVNDPDNRNVDPNTRIIDGQHLYEGLCPLLLGQNLAGLQIRGLTFRNMDHSTGNGGAIELIECGGLIENCVVQNCSALSGGGLWLSPRSTPSLPPFHVIDCNFTGNSAPGSRNGQDGGGGFYVSGSLNGDISNCSFNSNSATGWDGDGGGGFYVSGSLNGDISNCSFTGNSVTGRYARGGGFGVGGSLTGIIGGCTFTNNSATNSNRGNGGGFCIIGTLSGDVIGCNFIDNSAAGGYGGGGFNVGALNGNIRGSSFNGNSATVRHGGGFSVWGSLTGDVSTCSFTGNSATGYSGDGGGFYIYGNLTGNISACEFRENSSTSGGLAVSLPSTFAGRIESCIFSGHEGVAVYLANNSDTIARIRSCLFVAPETLGEVSCWAVRTSQKTIISNNTMVGPGLGTPAVPYLPSAIYIEFNTQAETGQIFNNIVVDTQCAIHVDAAVDMPITYNQFYNINEIVCQGEQGLGNEIWWLEYNLSNFRYNDYGDPLFFAYDAMYHIRETSPCVDAGNPNYVAGPNETDIDGQPRVYGYGVDRGADEYFTYILTADIYQDGIVNFLDFVVLARYWQQDEPLADIAPPGGDGVVDFLDLGILVDEWLLTEPWY